MRSLSSPLLKYPNFVQSIRKKYSLTLFHGCLQGGLQNTESEKETT